LLKQTPLTNPNDANLLNITVLCMQVHGFRAALWAEHAGIVSPNFAISADTVFCSLGSFRFTYLFCFAQVHGFRVALWAEHTGIVSPNFAFPADLDCVREMRQIGTINWNVRPRQPLLAPLPTIT